MASSGSFSGSVHSGHYVLRVDWTQTQNMSANTSTITAKIYLVNDWSLSIGSRTANFLTVDGTRQSFTSPAVSTTGTHLLNTVTQTVSHASDGSKTMDMACVFAIAATISGTYYANITASATVTLDTIPRASSVSMGTGNMGSASTITISRASSSFTHTLTYTFGSASGTIATKTSATSVSWTPPLTLANQIPNAASGSGTLTCTTYSGNARIGSKSVTITLKVPDSVVPTVSSLTAMRIDGDVPSGWGIYVQSKSAVTLTVNGAAGSYGSTIKSYSITGGGYSGSAATLTTGTLVNSGTYTFTATVTDSRGRTSAAKTVSISVAEYSPPSFSSYSTNRCNSGGTATDDGTYARGLVNYTYSSCGGNNTVTRATYYKRSTASSWTNANRSFNSGTAFTFGGGNISTEYTYDIQYRLTDAFATITVTDTVSTASVVMDFLRGGKGVAIGKVAETQNCFEVSGDWSAKFNGTTYLGISTLGGTGKPIYLEEGVPTVCDPPLISQVNAQNVTAAATTWHNVVSSDYLPPGTYLVFGNASVGIAGKSWTVRLAHGISRTEIPFSSRGSVVSTPTGNRFTANAMGVITTTETGPFTVQVWATNETLVATSNINVVRLYG